MCVYIYIYIIYIYLRHLVQLHHQVAARRVRLLDLLHRLRRAGIDEGHLLGRGGVGGGIIKQGRLELLEAGRSD